MSRFAAVLFDLDGTLLDTAPDMIGAVNRLRHEHGLEPVLHAALRAHVSHGAARLVRRGMPGTEGDEFERLRLRFLELYSQHLAEGTVLFPGMGEVLELLESARIPWGVVTNKPGWLTDPLLEALGLAARAACIVSGDTVAERKPHPLPLLHAAKQIDVAPERCLYVGDAERDIRAGRAAGMRTIAAAYGYVAPEDDLPGWGGDAIVSHPRELLPWLARSGADGAA